MPWPVSEPIAKIAGMTQRHQASAAGLIGGAGDRVATDVLARSFTWQVPGIATLRGAGMALLDRLPPLKKALARQMMFGSR